MELTINDNYELILDLYGKEKAETFLSFQFNLAVANFLIDTFNKEYFKNNMDRSHYIVSKAARDFEDFHKQKIRRKQ